MKNTFEQHLQGIFMYDGEVGGIGITKDNCDDLFETWLEQNIDIVMEEGQKFAETCYEEGLVHAKKLCNETIFEENLSNELAENK